METLNHIYSVRELKELATKKAKEMSELELKVLNIAMWKRACKANYHGYTEMWYNVEVRDGEVLMEF